jgi:hypothetical protein
MKLNTLKLTFAVAALTLVTSSLFAQAPQRVNVPFKFFIGNEAIPAGAYYVQPQASASRLEFRDTKQKAVASVTVITRLAAKGSAGTGNSVRLVFDDLSPSDRHLSEVWIPGTDGFLVRATTEKHEHQVVTSDGK